MLSRDGWFGFARGADISETGMETSCDRPLPQTRAQIAFGGPLYCSIDRARFGQSEGNYFDPMVP